jgi:hypothetical protein
LGAGAAILQGIVGADGAFSATDALLRVKEQLGRGAFGFGIVAPQTVEGAALEKDGGADAGPIVDAEFLNVE